MKSGAPVPTPMDVLKSTSVMSGSCSGFFFLVIACLFSSLVSSLGLPCYGVPDGSCFIKKCNDFIEFLMHAQVLTSCLNQSEFSGFLGILNAGHCVFNSQDGKCHLPVYSCVCSASIGRLAGQGAVLLLGYLMQN